MSKLSRGYFSHSPNIINYVCQFIDENIHSQNAKINKLTETFNNLVQITSEKRASYMQKETGSYNEAGDDVGDAHAFVSKDYLGYLQEEFDHFKNVEYESFEHASADFSKSLNTFFQINPYNCARSLFEGAEVSLGKPLLDNKVSDMNWSDFQSELDKKDLSADEDFVSYSRLVSILEEELGVSIDTVKEIMDNDGVDSSHIDELMNKKLDKNSRYYTTRYNSTNMFCIGSPYFKLGSFEAPLNKDMIRIDANTGAVAFSWISNPSEISLMTAVLASKYSSVEFNPQTLRQKDIDAIWLSLKKAGLEVTFPHGAKGFPSHTVEAEYSEWLRAKNEADQDVGADIKDSDLAMEHADNEQPFEMDNVSDDVANDVGEPSQGSSMDDDLSFAQMDF